MSGSYYCHECEERTSHVVTPLDSCSICGCNYIEEIPTVIEEDFNRQVDFFCNYSSMINHRFQVIHEEEEEDEDEEILEERCLYEQISSLYHHPAARNIQGSSQIILDLDEEEEEEEEDILAYDVLFEQRENDGGSTSIFQLPFTRIGQLLDTIYNRSDEESEEGDDYHRRSFLDNLADILSDFTQDIETTSLNNSPSIELVLSSFKKNYLIDTDSDVGDECIICQDTFGTTLEIFHLPCHHQFHGICISRWLNIKLSCPVCRQSVYDEEISNDRYMMTESVYEEVD